ncbi:UNC5C-like protein [Patella vulgata]|uniref:UNC5C-like protein n=1 Tax=Patella vulgata TaxID=6465 RepID=UPI00217FD192|nr:UNC5C-like protein [Patella vulgata]
MAENIFIIIYHKKSIKYTYTLALTVQISVAWADLPGRMPTKDGDDVHNGNNNYVVLIYIGAILTLFFFLFIGYFLWKCHFKTCPSSSRGDCRNMLQTVGHPSQRECNNRPDIFTMYNSVQARQPPEVSEGTWIESTEAVRLGSPGIPHTNILGLDNVSHRYWNNRCRHFATQGENNSLPTHIEDPGEGVHINNERHGAISTPSCIHRDSSLSELGSRMFEYYPETPKELLIPTERSQIRTISNKLLVYITKEVGYVGATLFLDNMGISLVIPTGAIPRDEKQLIILVLNWDLSDNPYMTETQALVSPVVYCGPHGVKLQKPALLRYKHCAFDPRDITIMESQTELASTKKWDVCCKADEQDGKCQVSQDECQILIDHFTLFTSIQTPQSGDGKKWLQVAVFASPLRQGMSHHQFRIYFLNKTPCALEWAKHNESRFSAELACPEKVFLLRGSREDVQLELQYLSRDWSVVDNRSFEKVQFLKVWHGMCPYIAVCFARSEDLRQTPKEINLNFSLFQESFQNEADKIVIQMAESNVGIHQGFDEVNISSKSNQRVCISVRKEKVLDVNIEGQRPGDYLKQIDLEPRFVIPWDLRRKLVQMLAPKSEVGKDWRDFGCELGMCDIRFLDTLPCPTTTLLDLFETKYSSLVELHQMLEKMERYDASTAVLDAIGTLPKQTCEDTDSD